jgi:hydrogenase expression/formation protein HypD
LLKMNKDMTLTKKLLQQITSGAKRLAESLGRRAVFMEVCGTHTANISRSGLRSLISAFLELRSGPGCPVCVTPVEDIDFIVSVSRVPNTIVAAFGDMIKVPGSVSTLEQERARGADIKIVYSPMVAVDLAEARPDKEVVLAGVGFETTAPLIALSAVEARRRNIGNYSIIPLNKLMPPALKALLSDPGFNIDGLILPGHVCAVTGRNAFDFVAEDYRVPAVVTGFETLDILWGIFLLQQAIEGKSAEVLNGYPRVVNDEGNLRAQKIISACFDINDSIWRGLGRICESGLTFKKPFWQFDVKKKFPVSIPHALPVNRCRCGDILKGKLLPFECPLFGGVCTPVNPVGPCMVSSEGACAAYFKYELGTVSVGKWSCV